MIFICNIIIYPLIKKNKIQPCVLVIKYRYRIQEHEKAYKQNVSLSKRKKKST